MRFLLSSVRQPRKSLNVTFLTRGVKRQQCRVRNPVSARRALVKHYRNGKKHAGAGRVVRSYNCQKKLR